MTRATEHAPGIGVTVILVIGLLAGRVTSPTEYINAEETAVDDIVDPGTLGMEAEEDEPPGGRRPGEPE